MASRRILYISPLPLVSNPAIDSIAYGIQFACREASVELRVIFDDARSVNPRESLPRHINAAIAARVDAIIFYVVNPDAACP